MTAVCADQDQTEMYEPYQALAYAIVRRAVLDYKEFGKKLETTEEDVEKKRISKSMKGISRFFLSGWYYVLTGAENGSRILRILDAEVFGDD